MEQIEAIEQSVLLRTTNNHSCNDMSDPQLNPLTPRAKRQNPLPKIIDIAKASTNAKRRPECRTPFTLYPKDELD
jgi:hypothetical protein